MTFGNIVMAVVIAIGAAIGLYIAYGREPMRAKVGANRLRNAVLVGASAGVAVLLVRLLLG